MLSAGDKIAGYEVVTELNAGGMATLYLAKRTGAGGFTKHVALKVVHGRLAKDPHFVDMFLDEARLSARIEHPNCVHVVELGEEDGVHFLVMEYVAGFSLAQVLNRLGRRKKRLTVDAAVHIAMRTAAGLHAAHELVDADGRPLGVVHRDISPQNILLADKGYVKLVDFGIAKALGRVAKTTAAGSLRGKYRYMSPEQARGQSVDRRTDVYALGVVLWEMLAMRRLFDGPNDLVLLNRVQNPEIARPERYAPKVSPALSDAIMKALEVDREDRYATARELQVALREAAPSAQHLDAPDLANLLIRLMRKEARARRQSLPIEVAPPDASPKRTSTLIDALKAPQKDLATAETDPRASEGPRPDAASPGPRATQGDVAAAARTTLREVATTVRTTRRAATGVRTTQRGIGGVRASEPETGSSRGPEGSDGSTTDGVSKDAPSTDASPNDASLADPSPADPSRSEAARDGAAADEGAATDAPSPPARSERAQRAAARRQITETRETPAPALDDPQHDVSSRAGDALDDDDPGRAAPPARERGGMSTVFIAVLVAGAAAAGAAVVLGVDAHGSPSETIPATPNAPPPPPGERDEPAPTPSELIEVRAEPSIGLDPIAPEEVDLDRRPRDPHSDGRAAEPGRLTFDARPWCDVTIDGRAAGRTPVVRHELAPGHHRVVCEHPEIGTRDLDVDIPSGETVHRSIALDE